MLLTSQAAWNTAEGNRTQKNWAGTPQGGFVTDNIQRRKDAQLLLDAQLNSIKDYKRQINEILAKGTFDEKDQIDLTNYRNKLIELQGAYANLSKEVQGFSMFGAIWFNMAQSTEDLAGALSDSFTSIVDGTKSVGDSFRDLAYNVIKYIQQMIIKQLAWAAASKIMGAVSGMFGGGGLFGGGGGSSVGNGNPGGVAGLFAASGGYIRGPGTGTSDSILAHLSNGEFVIKAASVAQYGPDFLDKLNRGLILPNRLPKFATGGLVGASQSH